LPASGKVAPVTNHPALPYAEVPAFVTELRTRNGAAQAFEFLILTAARTSEVLGATWDEFDLGIGLWTVPAERMKSGRAHRVPLSERAVEIVGAQPRNRKRPFPYSNMAFLQTLKRMERADITPHGFRSSFRDWAAETHDASRDVAEMALAHTVSDKTEAAYRRGDLFNKRRRLMDDWATFCLSRLAPAKVVALR
jgi:integrase